MKLTKLHERILEDINRYDISLEPIARAILEEKTGELGENDVKEWGVYVIYFPINVGAWSDDFQIRLEQICSGDVGHPEGFVGLEIDKKSLSQLLRANPLDEKEIEIYNHQEFPLGKGPNYNAFLRKYNKDYVVLALRETHTTHTKGYEPFYWLRALDD